MRRQNFRRLAGPPRHRAGRRNIAIIPSREAPCTYRGAAGPHVPESMTGDYISIGYGDLAIAAVLVVVNAGLSLRLGLGLERQMLVAAARMTVQLLLIGVVLKLLFTLVSLW